MSRREADAATAPDKLRGGDRASHKQKSAAPLNGLLDRTDVLQTKRLGTHQTRQQATPKG
jgi:hypothetical protein